MKIGIDLGGSHIAIGIIEDGKIIKEVSRDIREKNNIEDRTILEINEIINELLGEEPKKIVEKIGISAPGIIENR